MKKLIATLMAIVVVIFSLSCLASCGFGDASGNGEKDPVGTGSGQGVPNVTPDNGSSEDGGSKDNVNGEDSEETRDTTVVESGISFKTLEVNGTDVYGKVPNSTSTYSFINEITTSGNVSYVVSLDVYGMQTVVTKNVSLNEGDNVFYVLQSVGEDITLYTITIRRRPMYNVYFDTKGGTAVADQMVEEGGFVTVPTTSRTGYTFVGWDKDLTLPITENTTVSAQWTGDPFVVTYDANGGTVKNASVNVAMGINYTLEAPTRTGYTFAGWYYGNTPVDLTGAWNIAENVTLKAEWTANGNTAYKVEHYIEKLDGSYELKDTDNLTGKSDIQVTPSVNTYTGFTAPETQTITILPDGSRVVKYYYTRNSYTVTFVTNGGEAVAQQDLKYEAALPDVKRDGYTFGGWFSEIKLTTKITTGPANNIKLYAYWTEENKPSDFTYSGTDTITITDYTASDTTVCVPTYIGGKLVTSIGTYAFHKCEGLTSIEIPNSVTSIDFYAFRGCTNLTSITIPFVGATKDEANNTYFGYIFGASSYSYNDDYIPSSLKTVVITGGTSIGTCAFSGCTGLTSITIPSSVTSIGTYAFSGCTGLTSITIPSSVTSIGTGAFSGCTGLTSITIPSSVTSIGTDAFYKCEGLTSIEIPNGVTSIGFYAFEGCTGLTSITIPNSVTSIGEDAFRGCTSLESITLPFVGSSATASSARDSTLFGYIFGRSSYTGGIATQQHFASNRCVTYYIPSSLKSVTVTGGNVYYGAFYGCTNLTNVTIGNGVTSIGEKAFYNCEGLTSIEIPNSVTSIGTSAFYGCSGLESITIPNSVTTIGNWAFDGCTNLTSITIPFVGATKDEANNTYFGYIFGASSYSYNNDHIPSLKTVVITGGTSIGYYAFYGCTGLTSITIPDSVTTIGKSAFYGCSGLESITIPDGVTSIGDYAFDGCTGLTSIMIGNGVESIGSYAFEGCTGLTSITIGNGVESIGKKAFYNCSNLTSITIPDSVTSIGSSAFYGCSGLESITIPDGVTSIGTYAFSGCTGLTSVTIGNGVESIGSYAFKGCTGLTSITIPDSVTTIGTAAFYGCSGLESITIPDSVTSIGSSAFEGCTGLTSITIGNGVESIGSYAFEGCTGLTSITIGNGVESIGSSAFSNCSSLTSIYYTGTAEDWTYISISSSNTSLTSATRYYYSEEAPTDNTYKYWRYVDGVATPWEEDQNS